MTRLGVACYASMRRRDRIHHTHPSARLEADIATLVDAPHGPYDAAQSGKIAADPLAATILPPGDRRLGVGRESGRLRRAGISRHDDPYGSTRYLYTIDGIIASGLQVMSRDNRKAVIANVYTHPAFRRRGLAAQLLAQARRDFTRVDHADEPSLSDAGRGWRTAVERHCPSR